MRRWVAVAAGVLIGLPAPAHVGCQEPEGRCTGFEGRICFNAAQCGEDCTCAGLVFPPLEDFEQDPPGGSNITPGRCEFLGPIQGPEPPPEGSPEPDPPEPPLMETGSSGA